MEESGWHGPVKLLQEMSIDPSTTTKIHVGKKDLPPKETIQTSRKAPKEISPLGSAHSSVKK